MGAWGEVSGLAPRGREAGEKFGAGWVEIRKWVSKSRRGRKEREGKPAWDILVKFISL